MFGENTASNNVGSQKNTVTKEKSKQYDIEVGKFSQEIYKKLSDEQKKQIGENIKLFVFEFVNEYESSMWTGIYDRMVKNAKSLEKDIENMVDLPF